MEEVAEVVVLARAARATAAMEVEAMEEVGEVVVLARAAWATAAMEAEAMEEVAEVAVLARAVPAARMTVAMRVVILVVEPDRGVPDLPEDLERRPPPAHPPTDRQTSFLPASA